MNIQSLSIEVPNKKCINNCKFCVSQFHTEKYENHIESKDKSCCYLYENQYIKRLMFARDNGCNTVMLTGVSEPQQNKDFLRRFTIMNNCLKKPFRWIEMQTTGAGITREDLHTFQGDYGISIISLSVSSFISTSNTFIINMPPKLAKEFSLRNLIRDCKEEGLIVRLSVNLTNEFNKYVDKLPTLFEDIKDSGADQVTFRELYSEGDTEQALWVKQNRVSEAFIACLKEYIKTNGHFLNKLPYGTSRYDIEGISVVIDDDCMSKDCREDLKYLILRPDCHLYTHWDSKASLLF